MSPFDSASDLPDYAAALLHGSKTKLRLLQEHDLQHLAHWWNDPETLVLQHERALPIGIHAAEDLFRSWSANPGESGFGYCIVNASEELVGHIAVWGITPTVRIGTLAVIVGAPHRGRGYGGDAVRVALRLAFEELAVNKIELQVWSFNERALHLYRQLGFVEEGRRREAVYHRSAFSDQVLMGILRSEYENTRT